MKFKSLEITFDKVEKRMFIEHNSFLNSYSERIGFFYSDIPSEEYFNLFYENFKTKFNIKSIDYRNCICDVYVRETLDFDFNKNVVIRVTASYEPMTEEDIEVDRIETMIKNLS